MAQATGGGSWACCELRCEAVHGDRQEEWVSVGGLPGVEANATCCAMHSTRILITPPTTMYLASNHQATNQQTTASDLC